MLFSRISLLSEKWNWVKPKLHLLLNSETTEVDLDKWKWNPTECHEVVRFFNRLPREAPYLKKVSLGEKADCVKICPFHFFGDFIVDQVCQLKNLRYLSLNRACNFTEAQFIKLTKNLCKNLICLKVNLRIGSLPSFCITIFCVTGAV